MFMRQFADAAATAVNNHDAHAVVALWAEPATYTSPLTGPQEGLDALYAREIALFEGFPDLRATITVLDDQGRTGTMLVHFDGTHDGTYAGHPATGRTISMEMIAVVTFDESGHVTGERVFLDSIDIATAFIDTQ
ncbi:ester cyclase [Gordonia sp. VNQ95]|jgi:steroid delta-isomerase-like uncharacterized protein|uniref:ester cyclase n=1 Tax=Gordonia TaxID=2053 RepID=UPI0032B4362A